MAVRASRALRVLWRQDMSYYVPPILPAALVGGEYMLRYPSTQSSHTGSVPFTSSRDRLPERGRPRVPLPSTTWHAKYLCENPSEGTSLAAFTPCCAADIDALLGKVASEQTGPNGCSITREAAVTLLRTLQTVLREHQGLLAGAEALQTGVPVTHVEASIHFAEECLTQAADALLSAAYEHNMSAPSLPPSAPLSDEGAIFPRKDPGDRTVALCVTPAAFSLFHGIQAVAASLISGRYAHVVWCPSCDAALSAMWLMQKLQAHVGGAAEVAGQPGSALSAFSVALAGDPAANLLPALHAAALRHMNTTCGSRASVTVVTHGLTPVAAQSLVNASRQQLTRRNAGQPTEESLGSPSRLRLDFAHLHPSTPTVCVVGQPREVRETASASTPPVTPVSEATVKRLGKWVLDHSLSNLPRSTPTANGAVDEQGDPCRAPLLFVPGPSYCLGLLRFLALHGLGHDMRLGHSLDPSRRLGPLSSAAHLAAAKEVVRTATCTGAFETVSPVGGQPCAPDVRPPAQAGGVVPTRVVWTQVCGGFDLALTAPQAKGHLYVPAILYTNLDALVRDFLQPGPSSGPDEAANHHAVLAAVVEASRAVCLSVHQLTRPLEERYGGTAGACVFVCGHTVPSGLEGRQGDVLDAVSEGVRAFAAWAKKEDVPWRTCCFDA